MGRCVVKTRFWAQSKTLRNDLLAFRFAARRENPAVGNIAIPGVSHHLRQVYVPLLRLCTSDQHRADIIANAKVSHAQQLADRGLSTEVELLGVMREFYGIEDISLSITELCTRFKKKYGSQYDQTITPKWIGGVVRGKLLLTTRKSNGRYVISENQKEKIEALCERFDV